MYSTDFKFGLIPKHTRRLSSARHRLNPFRRFKSVVVEPKETCSAQIKRPLSENSLNRQTFRNQDIDIKRNSFPKKELQKETNRDVNNETPLEKVTEITRNDLSVVLFSNVSDFHVQCQSNGRIEEEIPPKVYSSVRNEKTVFPFITYSSPFLLEWKEDSETSPDRQLTVVHPTSRRDRVNRNIQENGKKQRNLENQNNLLEADLEFCIFTHNVNLHLRLDLRELLISISTLVSLFISLVFIMVWNSQKNFLDEFWVSVIKKSCLFAIATTLTFYMMQMPSFVVWNIKRQTNKNLNLPYDSNFSRFGNIFKFLIFLSIGLAIGCNTQIKQLKLY